MAFPVIEGQATSVSASKQTSLSCNIPSGVQAGELLVLLFNVDGDGPPPPVITTPSGWTSGGTSGNQYTQSVVFYKQASGSEGSTVSVSIDKANTMSAWCCRISGWNSVELSTVNLNASGSSPSSNSITPSWGADDTLWLYLAATGDDDQLMTAYPSGFTGQTSNISGGGTNNGPAVHVASRATNQATQAAATGTIQSSETWSCWMLAVEPGTLGSGGGGTAIAPLSYHHRFHNMSG